MSKLNDVSVHMDPAARTGSVCGLGASGAFQVVIDGSPVYRASFEGSFDFENSGSACSAQFPISSTVPLNSLTVEQLRNALATVSFQSAGQCCLTATTEVDVQVSSVQCPLPQ